MLNKIMLIEDDQGMRTLLETLLKLEGYQVSSVAGEEDEDLLATVIKESPEFVLLDVHLSHGSGIALLESIRQNQELNNIKIVMTSGMDFREKCIQKGAQGFIQKPYMPDELITMIKYSLEN